MSEVTESRVREVLNTITDPCSITAGVPAGMDDMGLIGDIQVRDDGPGGCQVSVTFGLTDPTCMLMGAFGNEARIRLGALPGVTGVDVVLDHDMEWTPDMLAPDYRQRLSEHRAERRRSLPLVTLATRGRTGGPDEQ
ncbi:iron-sulfur cluster assembly protein [Streptomyces sp. NBC_01003]|uniref:metal-sulfur cluster assembly factor n=1 Tax=Streptomyces sp. NBC_01003 TaxID=2903714 RepID=UPI00386338D1|nr:iron-sulfur cluster assembly protein [Streptomyces sp. NBC_01003]